MKPALIALALTAGCTSIVPSTVARLYALSPLEADPKGIAVALDLPETVGIIENSAQLVMSATRSDTNQSSEEIYILAANTGSDGSAIYTIAASDFDRIRAQQGLIQSWKEEADDATKGSIGVTVGGCKNGGGPDENAVMSIKVRTTESGTFFPLIRNAPITEVLELTEMNELKPCA